MPWRSILPEKLILLNVVPLLNVLRGFLSDRCDHSTLNVATRGTLLLVKFVSTYKTVYILVSTVAPRFYKPYLV